MKQIVLIISMFFALSSFAQIGKKELKTDSGTVVLHYFKRTKEISTKEWRDNNDVWGRSWAYNGEGKVIFERQTRRIAGHASVYFKYHANGGISLAEYSEAPDAGIQWHKSKTSFDEKGTQTSHDEWGHDNYDIYPRTDIQIMRMPGDTIQKVKQEVVECQKLYYNDVFVVNHTDYAMRTTVKVKNPSPLLKDATYTLAPGDTLFIGSYTMGEQFVGPANQLTMEHKRVTLRKKKKEMRPIIIQSEKQVTTEKRSYFEVVSDWRK